MNEDREYVQGEVAYEQATIRDLHASVCNDCQYICTVDAFSGEFTCDPKCPTRQSIVNARNRIADLRGEGY